MALISITLLSAINILAYVYTVLMVRNVNLIIDFVNLILVGTMVDVPKDLIQHLNVHVNQGGKIFVVKQK
ncbi:hypothetical protein I4U23_025218 [Adineta vaga]|nr:hypothetical protein I4U23_025218 [Adineta vaga]